jgi:hypothetical protein
MKSNMNAFNEALIRGDWYEADATLEKTLKTIKSARNLERLFRMIEKFLDARLIRERWVDARTAIEVNIKLFKTLSVKGRQEVFKDLMMMSVKTLVKTLSTGFFRYVTYFIGLTDDIVKKADHADKRQLKESLEKVIAELYQHCTRYWFKDFHRTVPKHVFEQ